MFTCEACGHPLAHHNPCNAPVGTGKRAKPCGCPAFQPDDLRQRIATLTDHQNPRAAMLGARPGGKP